MAEYVDAPVLLPGQRKHGSGAREPALLVAAAAAAADGTLRWPSNERADRAGIRLQWRRHDDDAFTRVHGNSLFRNIHESQYLIYIYKQ